MALRLFVAMAVPGAIKAALGRVRDELQSEVPHARISWTRPESMHLTLRFLGAVSPADVLPLGHALTEATRNFGVLELNCDGLGCFPGLRSPRILWAGVHDTADRLPQLSRQITVQTSRFTREQAEARFTGHITLGRIRQKLALAEARKISGYLERADQHGFGSWTATAVELMQSELNPGGSQYKVIEQFSLARS